MSIFLKLPGNRYEETVSRLFQYFFMNSKVFRRAFLENLSGKKGSKVHFSDEQMVSCEVEFPTESAYGNGRLDILLKLDNGVIGIESKFGASLHQDQHLKYLDDIVTEAHKMGKGAYFAIIAPKYKSKEVNQKLNEIKQKSSCIPLEDLTWEELSRCIKANLDAVKAFEPIENYVLLKHFSDYLETTVGEIQNFNFLFDIHKRDKFDSPRAQSFRQTILNHIYKVLSGFESGRQGSGAKHIGATFNAPKKDSEVENNKWVWIGFIEDPSKNHKGLHLVVNAVNKISASDNFNHLRNQPGYSEVKADDRNESWWKGYNNVRFIVEITEDWKKPEVIADALKPIIAYLEGN